MKNIAAINRYQLCMFRSSEGCWAPQCACTYSIYLMASLFSHMTKTEREGPSKSAANIYAELSSLLWRQEIIRKLMYTEYVPNTAFSIIWLLKPQTFQKLQSMWHKRQVIASNSHFFLGSCSLCPLNRSVAYPDIYFKGNGIWKEN